MFAFTLFRDLHIKTKYSEISPKNQQDLKLNHRQMLNYFSIKKILKNPLYKRGLAQFKKKKNVLFMTHTRGS